jgi:hypothetical protein
MPSSGPWHLTCYRGYEWFDDTALQQLFHLDLFNFLFQRALTERNSIEPRNVCTVLWLDREVWTPHDTRRRSKHVPILQQHLPQRLLVLRITKLSNINRLYRVSDVLFAHRLNRLMNFRGAPLCAHLSLPISYASVEPSSTMLGLQLETSKATPQIQLLVVAKHKIAPQKHSQR